MIIESTQEAVLQIVVAVALAFFTLASMYKRMHVDQRHLRHSLEDSHHHMDVMARQLDETRDTLSQWRFKDKHVQPVFTPVANDLMPIHCTYCRRSYAELPKNCTGCGASEFVEIPPMRMLSTSSEKRDVGSLSARIRELAIRDRITYADGGMLESFNE